MHLMIRIPVLKIGRIMSPIIFRVMLEKNFTISNIATKIMSPSHSTQKTFSCDLLVLCLCLNPHALLFSSYLTNRCI